MSGPQRVQRTRREKLPAGAVYVGRPTRWGNPFPVDGAWTVWTAVALGYKADVAGRRATVVALHRAWLLGEPVQFGPHASSTTGGSLEFDDGTQVSMADHVRGVASLGASVSTAPSIGAPPSDFSDLAGRDLACWCPLDHPCHADLLLELANV